MNWLYRRNSGEPIPLDSIPDISYPQLCADMVELLGHHANHCVAYFASAVREGLRLVAVVANDRTGELLIASSTHDYYSDERLRSLTPELPALHHFEREITELTGLQFTDSVWDKPLTYPANRFHRGETIDNYPFFKLSDPNLHQVQVGPVHAGIIEPGAFRFICDGEKIHHLEIALGYQHRGLEQMICRTDNRLRQILMAETIAGDSTVAHTTAMALILEGGQHNHLIDQERALAIELERMAVHIGDTSALCMDMGYQLGHVACEALRTIVINTTQLWCGNRFGRSLVRPFGSRFRLDGKIINTIRRNVGEVLGRYIAVRKDLYSSPGILARMENICGVSAATARALGAVGPAARASAVGRDIRLSHNFINAGAIPAKGYTEAIRAHEGDMVLSGDLLSRLAVRMKEVESSARLIELHLGQIEAQTDQVPSYPAPDYGRTLPPNALHLSLVEGWRGEICHAAITDDAGQFTTYKIVDPSRHNWMMLALSVRGAQISDFPVSNKSFNLSYCGHDL